jgi:DNA polymerase-3 subunit beta
MCDINTKELLLAVKIANKIAKGTIEIPIGANIALNKDKLIATDLKTTYQYNLNIDLGFKTTINAKKLLNYLKVIKDKEINIELLNNRLVIKAKSGLELYLETIPFDKFPQDLNSNIRQFDGIGVIDSIILKNLSKFAMDGDNDNILSCINFGIDNYLASTNGNVLISTKTDLNINNAFNINVNIFKFFTTGYYSVYNSDDVVLFTQGQHEFFINKTDRQYPSYKQLFPCYHDLIINIDSKKFKEALDLIKTSIDPRTNIVEFYINNNVINVQNAQIDFTFDKNKETEFKKIAFNWNYLKYVSDISNNFVLNLDSKSELTGALVEIDNIYKIILMPIQIP